MTDRDQINDLAKKVSDYADEIVALKQENSELKKRVAELEKPKKKRKFRAMTNSEFCRMYAGLKKFDCRNCSLYRQTDDCELVEDWELNSKKPYKTKDGKYILVDLENEIDEKDKEINELNKKIDELKQPKKAVKHQFFDFTEVKFHHVTSDQFIVSADSYISPELHRIFKQVTFYINGNEFYIGKCEVIKGRIKAKVISCQSYDLVAAQIIAKDLLGNDIYGNIKA